VDAFLSVSQNSDVHIVGRMDIYFSKCFVQRDTTRLTTENNELKLQLHSMEQQAQLQDGMINYKSF
jgi:hypothetical protein